MAMRDDDEAPGGAPAWVITYGDMMSLLLCFFILLASMSEIKSKEQYQAILDSLRRRFGHDLTVLSPIPGPVRPHSTTSKLAEVAAMGRARRLDTMNGGDKVRAPVGDNARVQFIRGASDRTLGGRVVFDEGKADLDEEGRRRLDAVFRELQGKPQKIEIRGHTSTRPLPPDSPFRDRWDLAYARCHNTMEYLVKLGINPKRLILGVAAENEPAETGEDPQKLRDNSRVEVQLLSDLASGLEPPSAKNPPSTAAGPK